MHQVRSATPCRQLREYVRAFAQREIGYATEDIVQPAPASLETILQFDFCNSTVIEYADGANESASRISLVGPNTKRRAWIRLRGKIESFGIFFQPLGPSELLRIPVRLLVNRSYAAQDVLGSDVWQLWESMFETASFEERVRLAEKYLLRRAENVARRTSISNSALSILQHQGVTRVGELAKDADIGVRQFERRFLDEIGMAPKLFSRITRFQTALDDKLTSPDRSWLTIAHGCGYHDQMHMIRDFQSLGSDTPGSLLLQLGDMRPPALAASKETAPQSESCVTLHSRGNG